MEKGEENQEANIKYEGNKARQAPTSVYNRAMFFQLGAILHVCMCVCVCIYVCICMHMCICVCIYVHECTLCVCLCVYAHIHIYVCS